jgi:hypothetical protein
MGQRPRWSVPVARLLGLFHAGTGLLLKRVAAPLVTNDMAQAQAVYPSVPAGDMLVADRGLCSYARLALLAQAGLHAVLRVGARQLVDFTPGRPLSCRVCCARRRSKAFRGPAGSKR